jgi:hypothetical protein
MSALVTADIFEPDSGEPVTRLYAPTREQVERQIEAEGLHGWTIRWGTAAVIANPATACLAARSCPAIRDLDLLAIHMAGRAAWARENKAFPDEPLATAP